MAGKKINGLTELEALCLEIEKYTAQMNRPKEEKVSKNKQSFPKLPSVQKTEQFNFVAPVAESSNNSSRLIRIQIPSLNFRLLSKWLIWLNLLQS